jgi:hypothetical protein
MTISRPCQSHGLFGLTLLSAPLGSAFFLKSDAWHGIAPTVQRAPTVFGGDLTIALRFFGALASEADGIRATVQHALNRLAAAYRNLPEDSRADLKQLLTKQSRSDVPGVRLCVLTWACSVFPKEDPFAWHLCLLAAADPKPEVRFRRCCSVSDIPW